MAIGLHKYTKTALLSATSYIGDSPLFLMDYLLRLMRVAVLLSLWRLLLPHGETVSGFTLPLLLTYSLLAEMFAELLEAYTDVSDAFWDGTIATRFIKPLSIFGQFTAEACGKWLFHLATFSLPLLLLAPLMHISLQPASWTSGLLFLPSLLLAVGVGLALDFLFTGIGIGLQFPPFAMTRARAAIAALLSGAFIPLALLPWNLGKIFGWLPFASMASAPLRIYTGTGDPLRLLILQAFWCAALWPLTLWLWRVSKEKMVSYGG